MAKQVVIPLPRTEIETGYPLTWRIKVPPGTERCTLLKAVLKVRAWAYRQRSAGSHTHTNPATGGAGGHDHGAIETDGVDATPGAHQTLRTFPGSGVNSSLLAGVATAGQAAATIRTDSVADHTHTQPDTGAATPPAAMAEAEIPNANLDILIDGVSYKASLGDGAEKLLFEEDIVDKIKTPGEHTIEFRMTSLRGGIEAEIELEW